MIHAVPFCLPADIDAAAFLRDYWQQKPLLIKNGLPALKNWFEPDDILALATEEQVLARLISEHKTRHQSQWQLKTSPLQQQDFAHLPAHWTLLVQNLEQWSPELGKLWQAFDFIPKWQQDDIMVSYAPNGGSVGKHYDAYDVFLAQGYGKRRWQLGKFCPPDTPFLPSQPIRLLDDMGELIFDEVLEVGDVLYVPPRLAHYGVAIGDCLTFSFGFRRPNLVQVLDKLADLATDHAALFDPLTLPQTQQSQAHVLTQNSIDAIKQTLLEFLNSPASAPLVNQAISEVLSRRHYELLNFAEPTDAAAIKQHLGGGGTLMLNPACRIIQQGEHWYIDGEKIPLNAQDAALLARLMGQDLTQAVGDDAYETLAAWVNDDWVIMIDDNDD